MSVLTTTAARAFLSPTDPTAPSIDETMLQMVIDAAENAIADRIGPLAVAVRTEQAMSYTGRLVLPVGPVAAIGAVLSVVDPYGVTIPGAVFVIDPGKVMRRIDYAPMISGRWMVTYSAGWVVVPAKVQWALRELVKHLWESNRPSGPMGMSQVGAAAHAFTWRVEEMLEHLDSGMGLGIL